MDMIDTIIKEKAYGKLNLSLDVLGKREDGYHEMLMVMQTISLHDDVTVTVTGGTGKISVSTNKHFLPNNEKNLGYKAAQIFMTELGINNIDVGIKIMKHIPVCAGMGGGSSDAAAVLRAMKRATGVTLTAQDLLRLGAKIGSDIPFCIYGGTAIARGRGTEIENIRNLFDCGIVAVKPFFSVSTPALFNKIDSVKVMIHPDTEGLVAAIESGSLCETARRCFNVFEEALTGKEAATVRSAKDMLLNEGAECACMTGTGSAVFGIFETHEGAKAAGEVLGREFKECFVATPVEKASEI